MVEKILQNEVLSEDGREACQCTMEESVRRRR